MNRPNSPGNDAFVIITGSSMAPTLRDMDQVNVVPYEDQKIRRGDVVVFRLPGEKYSVTHRVSETSKKGIVTRGDNSERCDAWRLSPSNIVGKAIFVKRGEKWRTVSGGLYGHLYARKLFFIRGIVKLISGLLRPAYHFLAQSSIFHKTIRITHFIKILSFSRPDGIEYKLLLGRRVIGRRKPGKKEWEIYPPFRLFVDESVLPPNNGATDNSGIKVR